MVGFPRRRRALPKVSSEPPKPRRVPTVSGERPPPHGPHGEDQTPGRVVAVYGPSGAGVSTILRVLHEVPRTKTALVEAASHEEVSSAIEWARADGAEVIFLDGYPRDAADVEWLYNQRYVTPVDGVLARLEHNAVVDPTYEALRSEIEARARDLNIFSVVLYNGEWPAPLDALGLLLSRSRISR